MILHKITPSYTTTVCISTSKTVVLSNEPFRNLYKYKYISLLDTDEVIIPLAHSNWSEMMSFIKKKLTDAEQIASFSFKHVYFGDWMEEETSDGAGSEIPSYFHMMRHVHRSTKYLIARLQRVHYKFPCHP